MDTALAGLSVALCDGDRIVAEQHHLLGRGHAEAIIPVVAEVMAAAGGNLPSAILVDVGPGSFTGLRIGIAAARALGLAWGVPVKGMRATDLVAAAAVARAPEIARLAVVLDAGRGRFYVERFGADLAGDGVVALDLDGAAAHCAGHALAGPAATAIATLTGTRLVADEWPRAADARLLPATACGHAPVPLYVGAPVAAVA